MKTVTLFFHVLMGAAGGLLKGVCGTAEASNKCRHFRHVPQATMAYFHVPTLAFARKPQHSLGMVMYSQGELRVEAGGAGGDREGQGGAGRMGKEGKTAEQLPGFVALPNTLWVLLWQMLASARAM